MTLETIPRFKKYCFNFKFKPGKELVIVDTLSGTWLPVNKQNTTTLNICSLYVLKLLFKSGKELLIADTFSGACLSVSKQSTTTLNQKL